jgi:ABC-type amino acid transport system permease subunit
MMELIDQALNWADAHSTLLWAAGVTSFVIFLATLIGLPFIIIKLPDNYLTSSRDHSLRRYVKGTPFDLPYRIAKNLLGVVLVLAGIAMLVLPGQGLLAIVVGLSLIKFPGKQRAIRAIVTQESILKSANWIREKAGKEPLQAPA